MSDCYIGVDVGGTKVAVGVLEDGELGHHDIRQTESADVDALVDEICLLAGSVGAREACENGEVVTANLVMLTVGTGVGGGIVIDGRPYRGASGAAAELGHTIVAADLDSGAPEPKRFPQPGSLESFAAGRALDRLAAEAADRYPDSALGRLRSAGTTVDGHHAVDAARDGDEVAVGLLRVLGERLGVGIANMINALDPDVVAIGGGVSTAGDLLLEPARRTAAAYVLPGVGTRTEIRLSRYGPMAGVLGAAILAKQELTREEGR